MLFLSGAAALLYEVAWFRRLHLVFGVGIFATGAVVAGFMLGLATGSRWAGSSRRLRSDPLRTFAWLEIGIALYAMAFPPLVGFMEGAYAMLFGSLAGRFLIQSVLRFIFAFLLLLPATFLMGASLPAMAQSVVGKSEELAKRVGWLYAANTLGGVAGILLAGFWALEHLGIRGSIYLGMVGNLVVAVSALLLARLPAYRRRQQAAEETASPSISAEAAMSSRVGFAVVTVTVTGLASMAGEIVWTRALVFFIHNSTYAFSSVVAVYLLGISGGAACATRLTRSPKGSMRWLAVALSALCLSTLCSVAVFRNLPSLATLMAGRSSVDGPLLVENWTTALLLIFGQVAAVLLLPAFFSGLVFPLTLRLMQDARKTTAGAVGTLYAANTVGCVVGTVLGTFVLVTVFGTRLALLLLAWLPAPVAMWSILNGVHGRISKPVLLGLFPVGLVVGSLLAAPPGLYRQLFEERFGKVIWFSEGVSETVAVCEHPNGSKWIQYSDGRGASGTVSFSGGWLYAHLPLLLHPDPQSALVICFGTGNTLGAASRHPLRVLDGVELSSEVVKASFIFSETNHDVASNENVNIIIGDGRNYLLAADKRYDVITEEPPLVHTSGVVNLYSKEFYQLCSDRMTEDGIIGVWLATQQLEERDLRMLVKAFIDVFPYASAWDCTHFREWFLIGSKKPLSIDLDDLERRMTEAQLATDLSKADLVLGGIKSPADLLSLHLKGPDFLATFAGDVEPVTDDKTVVDYTTPRHVRANFGLGERVTGGLYVRGVGRYGFRSQSEQRVRKFDSIYTSRDAAESLIACYGSKDPDSFLDELTCRRKERELWAALRIAVEFHSLARDLLSVGRNQECLDALEGGLMLVPAEARGPLYWAMAVVYHEMGRDVQSQEALQRARKASLSYERIRRKLHKAPPSELLGGIDVDSLLYP